MDFVHRHWWLTQSAQREHSNNTLYILYSKIHINIITAKSTQKKECTFENKQVSTIQVATYNVWRWLKLPIPEEIVPDKPALAISLPTPSNCHQLSIPSWLETQRCIICCISHNQKKGSKTKRLTGKQHSPRQSNQPCTKCRGQQN